MEGIPHHVYLLVCDYTPALGLHQPNSAILKLNSQCVTRNLRLPIHGKTSYVWEVFPYMGRLPKYGKSSHVWEVFPCMGRLDVYGKSYQIWEFFHHVGIPPIIGVYHHNGGISSLSWYTPMMGGIPPWWVVYLHYGAMPPCWGYAPIIGVYTHSGGIPPSWGVYPRCVGVLPL